MPRGVTLTATSYSGVETFARKTARECGAQVAQAGYGTASATRRAYARSMRRRRGGGGRLWLGLGIGLRSGVNGSDGSNVGGVGGGSNGSRLLIYELLVFFLTGAASRHDCNKAGDGKEVAS
ncbi:hypothetical protein DL770_001464 [Monosporascus sp. CRB-9-2]|nr:hypothetical protein DL770_001464 [Monosporascus sp. CRB-9-2]